jgi:hypothetical protein
MRARMVAVLGAVVVLVAGAAGAQGPEFKPYASTDGRYKVLFPGPVKTDTVEVKAEQGNVTVTIDTVELRAGISFLVSYVDAADEVAQQPAGPRFDKVRDAIKGADGKVIEDKELTLGVEKHPARDVLIEKPSGCIRNRIVIAGNRLYQVMIQGPKEVVTSPSADRFLASFEVTK